MGGCMSSATVAGSAEVVVPSTIGISTSAGSRSGDKISDSEASESLKDGEEPRDIDIAMADGPHGSKEAMAVECVALWTMSLESCIGPEDVSKLKQSVLERHLDGSHFDEYVSECRLIELGVHGLSARDMARVRKMWRADLAASSSVDVSESAVTARRTLGSDFHGAHTGGIARLLPSGTGDISHARPRCVAGMSCRDRSGKHLKAL
eukprot:CAMPEP_0180581024 /NCGR_PEP_ID=MMETSP1037_2-20121125/13836_1 /TAXON_ID=632150 /ORGANISM="Azadinium spinosum, Strain 3D9" /LENGTH=206 /DNA_ID=CAMNT_0022598989 /DNA_START=55 /DNA_END=672 /DNA_ORIENTATION=-